jgi:hypothetical protein
MFVGLIELGQGIADPFLVIEGMVPLQTTDDLKAQVLDTAAELGGGEPGVYQEVEGRKATDADILALLSQRPCTVQAVSAGLGLHVGETAKRLQALVEEGSVTIVRNNKIIFYETVRTKGKGIPVNHY